jgi:hypothetical protein
MNRVPNLLRLRSAKKSEYLYQLYLLRLTQSSRWERTLEACRQIRSFAARAGRPRLADFTYYFEIDALCQLGKFPLLGGKFDASKELRSDETSM